MQAVINEHGCAMARAGLGAAAGGGGRGEAESAGVFSSQWVAKFF
jgi:hypothetical protein